MEEQYQNPEPQVSVLDNQVPPQPIKKNKSGAKWLLIVILLLLIAGVAGFFLTQSQTEEELPTPTPFIEDTPTDTPEPSVEPISKKDIKIEIQNGTGLAGEAGFLQTTLKGMGYENITVGNAETQDATTTTITFSSKVQKEVQDELTTKLKTIYTSLETKTSSTLTKSDILIVTGTRKGSTTASASPKPSATATAKPSTSPTASPL